MNDLVVIENRPTIPAHWDYNASVNTVKQVIYKWKNLTIGLGNELWVAREILSSHNRYREHTWTQYCLDIGSQKDIVNRWLQRLFPDATLVSSEPLMLPANKYRTIIIDPPWPTTKIQRATAPMQTKDSGYDYRTLVLERIQALRIGDLASDDGCHLYLWATQRYLQMAFNIVDLDWGFRPIFTMVWHKAGGFQPFKLPQYNCEFVLFGRKGNLPFSDTKNFFTCFNGARREHSRKPDEFYDLVRRVSPAPRIDVFSREKRDGFDQYGDEPDRF